MPNRPEVLDHLGPYVQHGPIAGCCELSERVWRTYNELTTGYVHSDPSSREYLILCMLYIAEITSTAIRLNTTWGLTHAAMSLLRDRYEQTVRFSWLVRNPDKTEFGKYERTKVAKINSIVRNLEPDTIKHFEAILGPTPAWATETPTKEDRTFLEAWNTLDLKSMALKRDAFPALADTVLAKKKLASSYEAIYRQFSSVSHYDRFSIELLGCKNSPTANSRLARDRIGTRSLYCKTLSSTSSSALKPPMYLIRRMRLRSSTPISPNGIGSPSKSLGREMQLVAGAIGYVEPGGRDLENGEL